MLKHNNNISELQDLLDSDDELPTNYKEEPALPAYLDDQRFDAIQFNWIKNNKIRSIPVKPHATSGKARVKPAPDLHLSSTPQSPYTATKQENLPVANQGCSNKLLLKKGILNEVDILCMKGVAASTTEDAALLWFIDFLIYKDLQADYRFLKSCLVISHENYGRSSTKYSQKTFPKSLKNCFELVVK